MKIEDILSALPSKEDILSALPSKEDLAQSVGLQPQDSNGDLLTAVGIFGTGLIVGAGLALLFAPKPGSELRQDIAHKVNEMAGSESRIAD